MPAFRTKVEDAVIAKLRALAPHKVRSVKSYGGELTDATLDDIRDRLAGHIPGILVVTGGSRIQPDSATIGNKTAKLMFDVVLHIVCGSLRSREEKNRNEVEGDGAGLGAYDVLELVQQVLMGASLGVPGTGKVRGPIAEESAGQTPDLSIWRAIYEVEATVAAVPPDLGLFTELEAQHGFSSDEDESADPIVTALTELPS